MENSIDGPNFLTSPRNDSTNRGAVRKLQTSSRLVVSRGSTRPSVGANIHSVIETTSQPGDNGMTLGANQRFYQTRPITENRPKRGQAIDTQIVLPSTGYFSQNRQSSQQQKPMQQVTRQQAKLISKKGFLKREQFTKNQLYMSHAN